ncbi:hypothetical protein AAFF_G00211340 [Aldrovandia affinis]|uniref:Uncharacterized protein n=1 Tax=Aldrovandia affinis TaxID=143900 RepID=A0AAD7SWR1_9TELE|nr:hypothetical protein AAFF_G00211340 [Aldrovandia affinis]
MQIRRQRCHLLRTESAGRQERGRSAFAKGPPRTYRQTSDRRCGNVGPSPRQNVRHDVLLGVRLSSAPRFKLIPLPGRKVPGTSSDQAASQKQGMRFSLRSVSMGQWEGLGLGEWEDLHLAQWKEPRFGGWL